MKFILFSFHFFVFLYYKYFISGGYSLRVLVTGATGFIGSHVADLLLEKNYTVRCTIRRTSNIRWLKDKPIELVETDFANLDSLVRATKDVDYIVHSAGVVAAKNYEGYLKGNRDATANLLKATLLNKLDLKRFVHISSQTVVGPAKSLDKPFTEDMTPNPITKYAKSKLAAEMEVLSYKNILPITIVRPPAVFGPRDTAVFQMFQVAQKGLGTLIGFNRKYLNLIYSDDLARGIVDAMESEKSIGETYFIASEDIYDWNQIINAIKTAMGKNFFIKIRIPHTIVYIVAGISEFFGRFSKSAPVFNIDKGRDFVQNYWICSVEKAKRDLNFKQETDLEKGIDLTIKWYKANGWLKS